MLAGDADLPVLSGGTALAGQPTQLRRIAIMV
jgi:hypothetical protein